MSLLHRQRLMPTRPAWCDLPYIQHDRQPVQARGLAPLAVSLQLGKSPHPHLDPQRRGPQGRTADPARDLPAPQLGGQGDQPALLRSRPRTYTGVWLQLLLPAELVGTNVQLPPAMVDSGWFSDRKETSSIKSWELLQRNYQMLHWIMKHLIFTNC